MQLIRSKTFCAVLVGYLMSCTGSWAMTIEEFRSVPDYRVAIRVSQGVRYARPLSATTVETFIGVTGTDACRAAEAWRVISFDDPDYEYDTFVRPKGATGEKQEEVPGVAGAPFKTFACYRVTLELPTPMKKGKKYFFLAQGINAKGALACSTHTCQGFVYNGDTPAAPDTRPVAMAVLGLRRLEPVGPKLLMLDFGANFAAKPGTTAANYAVTVNDKKVNVVTIGRRTMVDTYQPVGWPFKALPEHKIYLELAEPFKDGDSIKVTATKDITLAERSASIVFVAKKILSNSIKVNQIGYLTDSPAKVGYLGRWMGSFPEGKQGNPALLFPKEPSFEICDEKTGNVVFEGTAVLKHTAGERNEGVYKVDHAGENVYWLDFTSFRKEGTYFISIPEVGRSLTFAIGDDVYRKAFDVLSHGVYTQRCGIRHGPPSTEWRRIACHKKGIIASTLDKSKGEHGAFKDPGINNRVDPNYKNPLKAFGGHHDAGDYNPRSHIEVAYHLMNAYEMAPQKFYDGQTCVPEQGNGVPDILDEAYWAMQLWIGLQDTDGGVFNGTESNGDPGFMQSVELDPKGDYAFAKDAQGSYTFAGVMAQASRLWKSVGKTAESADFLSKGIKAYEWAVGKDDGTPRTKDAKAFAAAQMLHTTGDKKYNADFKAVCAWTQNPKADLDVYKKYDQHQAAWAYATCPANLVDQALQTSVKNAIKAKADIYISLCKSQGYWFLRHPWAPINWGTGAHCSHALPALWTYHLTKDKKYLMWVIRTADNACGANPMNLSWTVNLGTRTVRAPLHNSRYSHLGEVVTGQQVQGPHHQGAGYRVKEVAYPKLDGKFASLQTFCDNHWCIAMDEGTIPATAIEMSVYGLLLPDRKSDSDK